MPTRYANPATSPMPSGNPALSAPRAAAGKGDRKPLMKKTASALSNLGLQGDAAVGPQALADRANRMADMLAASGQVYTPDPLSAAAKALTGGFLGYQKTAADKATSEGKRAWQERMSKALTGGEDPLALLGDEWASPQDKQLLMGWYERNNLTPMETAQLEGVQLNNRGQLQNIEFNEDWNPMRLREAELGIQGQEQTLGHNERMYPLVEEGQRLGNQGQLQTMGFNEQLQPLKLREAELNIDRGEQDLAQSEQAFDLDVRERKARIDLTLKQLEQATGNKWVAQEGADGIYGYETDQSGRPTGNVKKVEGIPLPSKGDSRPDLIQMYDWAGKDPEKLAFIEKMKKAGAGGMTVDLGGGKFANLPTLQQGWSYRYNPDGSVMLDENNVPQIAPMGGSEDAQRLKLHSGIDRRNDQKREIVNEDVSRAINTVTSSTLPTTGVIGDAIKNFYQPGKDVEQLLNGIKSYISIEALTDMRMRSPTGAAMGNVSDKDIALLQSAYGALEQAQSEEQFLYNLDRLNRVFDEVIRGPNINSNMPRPNENQWQSIRGEGFRPAPPPRPEPGSAESMTDEEILELYNKNRSRVPQ